MSTCLPPSWNPYSTSTLFGRSSGAITCRTVPSRSNTYRPPFASCLSVARIRLRAGSAAQSRLPDRQDREPPASVSTRGLQRPAPQSVGARSHRQPVASPHAAVTRAGWAAHSRRHWRVSSEAEPDTEGRPPPVVLLLNRTIDSSLRRGEAAGSSGSARRRRGESTRVNAWLIDKIELMMLVDEHIFGRVAANLGEKGVAEGQGQPRRKAGLLVPRREIAAVADLAGQAQVFSLLRSGSSALDVVNV